MAFNTTLMESFTGAARWALNTGRNRSCCILRRGSQKSWHPCLSRETQQSYPVRIFHSSRSSRRPTLAHVDSQQQRTVVMCTNGAYFSYHCVLCGTCTFSLETSRTSVRPSNKELATQSCMSCSWNTLIRFVKISRCRYIYSSRRGSDSVCWVACCETHQPYPVRKSHCSRSMRRPTLGHVEFNVDNTFLKQDTYLSRQHCLPSS